MRAAIQAIYSQLTACRSVDDLDECEKDAVEDCKQVLEMQSDTHFPQPDQTEVDELQEEITSRLAYLVQRRVR